MITQDRVKELLDYCPESGEFFWKVSRRAVKAGDKAGKVNGRGYGTVGIDRKDYQSHRLAWLYVYGEWPDGCIDHVNGIRTDNRISNLRIASSAENAQNRRFSRAGSKCGLIGVAWHKQLQRWQAQIKLRGVTKYLGLFDSPEEANAAYLKAKAELHPFQTLLEGAK